MDLDHPLGTGKKSLTRIPTLLILLLVTLTTLCFGLPGPVWADAEQVGEQSPGASPGPWLNVLHAQLLALDADYPGELGVYVKHLQSGETLSFRGEEAWYLASAIKIPVAIQVLRGIERGDYTLETRLRLAPTDFVDGAGPTKWQAPGTELSIRKLLERMLILSDNTATDRLIRLVGLEQVNRGMQALVPMGLNAITTLADVRRHAYSAFHQDAFRLTGEDFFALRNQPIDARRIETLAQLLNVKASEFTAADMDSAFAAYYATELNAGQLSAFGDLLELLVGGEALGPGGTAYLMGVLGRVETGANRIRAGLPAGVAFAHKTGTQRGRTCDLGVASTGADGHGARVIIAACTRGERSTARSEQALGFVGEAVARSGVLHMTDPM